MTRGKTDAYPLYQHGQHTSDFPKEFYDKDNRNFIDYKSTEGRIFANREKMV